MLKSQRPQTSNVAKKPHHPPKPSKKGKPKPKPEWNNEVHDPSAQRQDDFMIQGHNPHRPELSPAEDHKVNQRYPEAVSEPGLPRIDSNRALKQSDDSLFDMNQGNFEDYNERESE